MARLIEGPCLVEDLKEQKLEVVEQDDPMVVRYRCTRKVLFVPPGCVLEISDDSAVRD